MEEIRVVHIDTELRKAPLSVVEPIAEILELNNDWEKIMISVPKDLSVGDSPPKYRQEDIIKIKEHAFNINYKCSRVFFDEWGTSGIHRPTLNTLKELLRRKHMIKAYVLLRSMVYEDNMDENMPIRPTWGPGASIETNVPRLLNANTDSSNLSTTAEIQSNNATDGSVNSTANIESEYSDQEGTSSQPYD